MSSSGASFQFVKNRQLWLQTICFSIARNICHFHYNCQCPSQWFLIFGVSFLFCSSSRVKEPANFVLSPFICCDSVFLAPSQLIFHPVLPLTTLARFQKQSHLEGGGGLKSVVQSYSYSPPQFLIFSFPTSLSCDTLSLRNDLLRTFWSPGQPFLWLGGLANQKLPTPSRFDQVLFMLLIHHNCIRHSFSFVCHRYT